MATKTKYHYYVLVFTNEGPKYVTKIGEHHTAYWYKEEKPLELSKDYALQMVTGLLWNGYSAITIISLIKITKHPYNYVDYEILFKEKEEN